MQVGMQIVAANPLAGIGTGAFAEAYAPTARALWPAGTEMATDRHQPHSEFLHIAVQLGLLGLIPYFGMLVTLVRPALAVRSFETDVLVLMWTIYVFASTFSSLLWDTTEAYWFLLLSGPLYVAARRAAAARRQLASPHMMPSPTP
jgi:O-antigen ligase